MLAQRIKSRREELHMTQEQLAVLIGKNQKQIWQYESGRTQPTASVIANLCEALSVSSDWLLGRTDISQRPLRGYGDLDEIEIEVVRILRERSRSEREQALAVLKALATTS